MTNTSLKPIRHYYYEQYGKEYYMEYKHKIRLKNIYNIEYSINPAKYNIKQYFKST
jgi:hypothetical protein